MTEPPEKRPSFIKAMRMTTLAVMFGCCVYYAWYVLGVHDFSVYVYFCLAGLIALGGIYFIDK